MLLIVKPFYPNTAVFGQFLQEIGLNLGINTKARPNERARQGYSNPHGKATSKGDHEVYWNRQEDQPELGFPLCSNSALKHLGRVLLR